MWQHFLLNRIECLYTNGLGVSTMEDRLDNKRLEERVAVRISKAMKDALVAKTTMEGKKISEIVLDCLNNYLSSESPKGDINEIMQKIDALQVKVNNIDALQAKVEHLESSLMGKLTA